MRFSRRNGGRAKGFLAESGACARARASARGSGRLKNSKRARNARERARGSEGPGDEPELDAFSPRQSDVALAFSRLLENSRARRFSSKDLTWTTLVSEEEQETLRLPTLPHAHAAHARTSRFFHHSTTTSMGQAATKLGHGGASPPRGSGRISVLPKMRSRAKRNIAIWQFWSSRRCRSRHVSSSKRHHGTNRTANAARVTDSERSRASPRTRARERTPRDVPRVEFAC